MSDANFINAYNEVILENLNAIMKQNFMFQTQIKFLEKRVNDIPEMEKKLANFEKDKSVELEHFQNSTGDFEKKLSDKQNDYNHLMDEKNNLAGEVLSLKNEAPWQVGSFLFTKKFLSSFLSPRAAII